MTVHHLPTEQLSTAEQLKTTATLRRELQDDIAELQLVIKSASETVRRARLTIVQLSLHEDRNYALEMSNALASSPSDGRIGPNGAKAGGP